MMMSQLETVKFIFYLISRIYLPETGLTHTLDKYNTIPQIDDIHRKQQQKKKKIYFFGFSKLKLSLNEYDHQKKE